MGRFDDCIWEEKEDFSEISKLKISKDLFYEFYKKLVKLIETEGL